MKTNRDLRKLVPRAASPKSQRDAETHAYYASQSANETHNPVASHHDTETHHEDASQLSNETHLRNASHLLSETHLFLRFLSPPFFSIKRIKHKIRESFLYNPRPLYP